MHHGAALRADLFRLNFENSSARVGSRIMLKEVDQQEENKTVIREIVSAVEFLAIRDDKVDFSSEDVNRGNFIATLRLLSKKRRPSKTSSLVPENARYTNKTIQNEILNIYAFKILTKPVRENSLPFTIIADKVTDPRANQEILGVFLRFVDLSALEDLYYRNALSVSFAYKEPLCL